MRILSSNFVENFSLSNIFNRTLLLIVFYQQWFNVAYRYKLVGKFVCPPHKVFCRLYVYKFDNIFNKNKNYIYWFVFIFKERKMFYFIFLGTTNEFLFEDWNWRYFSTRRTNSFLKEIFQALEWTAPLRAYS